MSVRPRSFLDLAGQLISSIDEIGLRTSINRAYYSVLHRAREVIPNDCFERDARAGSHELVIRAAEKLGRAVRPGRTAGRELARGLRRLRESRVRADYEVGVDINAEYAADAIARAHVTWEQCDDIERQISSAAPSKGPSAPETSKNT